MSGPTFELRRVFSAGEVPSVPALIGDEFRRFNHPRLMSLLGIRKFIKVFFTGRTKWRLFAGRQSNRTG